MATETGTRIRLARERKRWSQQQLADATGVDVKTVRNWERTGKIRNRQGAIEAALGVSLDDEPAQRPSVTAEEALDRALIELNELRQALRDQSSGKGDNDDENGSRRAG